MKDQIVNTSGLHALWCLPQSLRSAAVTQKQHRQQVNGWAWLGPSKTLHKQVAGCGLPTTDLGEGSSRKREQQMQRPSAWRLRNSKENGYTMYQAQERNTRGRCWPGELRLGAGTEVRGLLHSPWQLFLLPSYLIRTHRGPWEWNAQSRPEQPIC